MFSQIPKNQMIIFYNCSSGKERVTLCVVVQNLVKKEWRAKEHQVSLAHMHMVFLMLCNLAMVLKFFKLEILGGEVNEKVTGLTNQNFEHKNLKKRQIGKTKMMDAFGWESRIFVLSFQIQESPNCIKIIYTTRYSFRRKY